MPTYGTGPGPRTPNGGPQKRYPRPASGPFVPTRTTKPGAFTEVLVGGKWVPLRADDREASEGGR